MLLLLSSGCTCGRLERVLGWGPVDKTVGDFVHQYGLVNLAPGLERGQLQALHEGGGTGGAAEISGDAAGCSSLHCF